MQAQAQILALPTDSLLAAVRDRETAYVDAYSLWLPRAVGLPTLVQAFYTSPLFRLERALLALFGAPSRDAQAVALARGEGERFAVWAVAARRPDELLLTERSGVTSSWLAVQAEAGGTRLCFGSALRTRRRDAQGRPQFSGLFHALLGLHQRYSRALLQAAARRLRAGA